MKPARRRSTLLVGLTILVAILVGGRWLAIETAERAWAASLGTAAGGAYLSARDLARLVRGCALLVSIGWGTANLYYVYRAIGSVQLPRRLGDLEIVEAVPQRVLLAGTLASGVAYGLVLTLGSGDWWLKALIASAPPTFGAVDPILHRDLGYYVSVLPWTLTCQHFVLLAAVSALLLVGFAYLGIGSLRFSPWRAAASPHARGHLGVLLAILALALSWGALLDPAEVVGGLHGALQHGTLAVRVPGARYLVPLGILAAVASAVWVVREQVRPVVVTWGVLLVASLAIYVALPNIGQSELGDVASARDQLERQAFGADWRNERLPQGFASAAVATARMPVWDPDRVAARARRQAAWRSGAPVAGIALAPPRGTDEPARWIVVPAPAGEGRARSDGGGGAGLDWSATHHGAGARAGRPFEATEAESLLILGPIMSTDSASWFGPAFTEFAVAAPDTWPALRAAGIPLDGWWRRTALAWVLQSPELAKHETDRMVLLWRRDAAERLDLLAPFATFEGATPAIVGKDVWWISYGYATSDVFPIVRPLSWPGSDRPVRYVRTGFVGAVNAASGATFLYLAPGADSLARGWARLFGALVHPADSIPPELRGQLPYPRDAFQVATEQVSRTRRDSAAWEPVSREPFEVDAVESPAGVPRGWTAQGFESGSPAQLAALLVGTMSTEGPSLRLWTPTVPIHLPTELLGSPETAPGVMRLWPVDGAVLTVQALFAQPATSGVPSAVNQVYLTWGDRASEGATGTAAVRALLSSGATATRRDTSLAARWELARRLAAAADSALAAGNLETFGRLYGDLTQLLGVGRALAPTPRRR